MGRKDEGTAEDYRRQRACKNGLGKHRCPRICVYLAVLAVILKETTSFFEFDIASLLPGWLIKINKGNIMKIRMILIFIVILCSLSSCTNISTKQSGDRIYLTGEDLSAWRGDTGQWKIVGDTFINPDNEKLLSNKPGTGIVINGPTGKTNHLISKAQFGDIKAHIEFMISKDSNSGVYFAGRYEVQIYDSFGVAKGEYPGIECGGIYERWDENRSPKGYEGHSPRVNASRPAGQWQSFDVIFRAPRFDEDGRKIANARFEKIVHNGIVVHENVELTGPTRSGADDGEQPTGPLLLQGDHGPVAYRNIWIEPIGTNPLTSTAW
jgi:hypothetical protein